MAPLSTAIETRLLAHWRTLQSELRWFELLPLLRRGLAVACGTGIVVAGISFSQIKPSTPDAWAMARRVTNATYLP